VFRVAAIMLILLGAGLLALPTTPAQVPDYLPHAPIVIRSDQDLENPLNGVTSGSGTEADPYVIQGWDIQFSGPLTGGVDDVGILIRGTTAHVVVRDCLVIDAAGSRQGIVVQAALHVLVEDVYVQGHRVGIALEEADDVRVANSTLGQNAETGVLVQQSRRIVLEDNTVEQTVWEQEGSGTIVGDGVYVVGSEDVVVARNDVSDNGRRQGAASFGVGLRVDDASVRVLGNRFVRNGQGIELGASAGSLVTGNEVSKSDREGIVLSGHEAVVSRNVVRDGAGAGVVVMGQGNHVLNNTVRGNAGVGIMLVGQGNLVAGNTVTENVGAGLELDGHASRDNLVRDNDFRGNGGADILVQGRIGSNRFENNLGEISREGSIFTPPPALSTCLAAVAAGLLAARGRRPPRAAGPQSS
jgi:parallel beta-helix repeat protein